MFVQDWSQDKKIWVSKLIRWIYWTNFVSTKWHEDFSGSLSWKQVSFEDFQGLISMVERFFEDQGRCQIGSKRKLQKIVIRCKI